MDPLAAALAAQAVAGAQLAMDEAVLSLGASLPALQAQLSVGDVVAATVLPPQGGSDLLSFLGQTVRAQLPAGIDPGQALALQVTGFTNSAVIVKNLGTIDPQHPIPTVDVQLPAPGSSTPPPAGPASVVPASLSEQAAASTPPPAATPGAVAPPREVFVAASVQPPAAPPPSPGEGAGPAAVRTDIEARIDLMRAAASAPRPAPPPSAPPPAAQSATARGDLPGRLPSPPPIVLSGSARTPQPGAAREVPATPEGALLARLRVPATPTTLAAARAMEQATTTLTKAYQRLEAVLGRTPESAPPALRSFLGFISRLDLRSTAALPEQIAAFVSDVVDGSEAKIAQAVRAWLAVEPPTDPVEEPPPSAPGAASAPALAATPSVTPAQVTSAAAVATERSVALAFDAKTVMAAALASDASSPALAGALRDALTATTAVQLNVLQAQANDPSSIVLALPAYFHANGEPVHLRIARDAPDGSRRAMDGDNFHIAFVLDTATMGTVAIDVQTVGRAVTVDVRTERAAAADRFRSSFGDLRARLERLRYRIAAAGAGVAPALGAQPTPVAPETPPARRSFWDMRA
jgi:hypothetical protein